MLYYIFVAERERRWEEVRYSSSWAKKVYKERHDMGIRKELVFADGSMVMLYDGKSAKKQLHPSYRKELSWIQLLEAIFTTMQRLNVLNSPFTAFSLITPKKEESPHDFAWRLWDAFYQLSGKQIESQTQQENF